MIQCRAVWSCFNFFILQVPSPICRFSSIDINSAPIILSLMIHSKSSTAPPSLSLTSLPFFISSSPQWHHPSAVWTQASSPIFATYARTCLVCLPTLAWATRTPLTFSPASLRSSWVSSLVVCIPSRSTCSARWWIHESLKRRQASWTFCEAQLEAGLAFPPFLPLSREKIWRLWGFGTT